LSGAIRVRDAEGAHMIVLGLILLIIGLVASVSILTIIGLVLIVVGLVLNLVPIGGTRRRVF
jgi:hypothetical protein